MSHILKTITSKVFNGETIKEGMDVMAILHYDDDRKIWGKIAGVDNTSILIEYDTDDETMFHEITVDAFERGNVTLLI